MEFLDNKRASGILLHLTSLPNQYGIGGMGQEAYDFVDYLATAKQKFWQVLPLGHTGYGDSPYQTFSAFAGNPILIDLEILVKDGYLNENDLGNKKFPKNKVDYGAVIPYKYNLLDKAYEVFSSSMLGNTDFDTFMRENAYWLNDYALFMSLKDKFKGKSWIEWEDHYRYYDSSKFEDYSVEIGERVKFYKFIQFIFFKQWFALKNYANSHGVKIIGDIPIYVALDSAEAWSKPELFHFNEQRIPTKVAGVPPDYFSKTGQLWGNPLYNWDVLKANGFSWWIERISVAIKLYDVVRIDHFRGFVNYYAIPYGDKTAENGWWEDALGEDLFNALQKALGEHLPIIAEDLGFITGEILALRDKFKFPGMKIIQFGFDSSEGSPYIPHLFEKSCVAYTGTHDNDTIIGWYNKVKKQDKEYVNKYLNIQNTENINWDFIRLTYASVAELVVFPMQDILGLDTESRMNVPGKLGNNWQWRIDKKDFKNTYSKKLEELAYIYKR